MPLLDVSRVTRTLVTLIDEYVSNSPAWVAGPVSVTPRAPDQLEGDSTLGVYLYHLQEDGFTKNLPPPGGDEPPVRFTPMGLDLHYQVTPHSDVDGDAGSYREQLMMGLAMKALHDYPVVDETTQIDGTDILDPALAGAENRLRILLQPVPHTEAVNYWTAGSTPLRLAAYYEVSVVLLEPEEPRLRSSRVLDYGVFAFAAGLPRLEGSRSALAFTVPGETQPRTIEARPAQAPVGAQVTFDGSSLVGDGTTLFLRSARWDEPVEADAAWDVTVTAAGVTATVRSTASGEAVLPGVYSAFGRVVRRKTLPTGLTREFLQRSNETPFLVVPRLAPIGAPTAAGVFTVTGETFEHPDLPAENVEAYVGDAELSRRASGTPAPGEFRVVSATQIRFRLPAGLAAGSPQQFRLVVNGAESAPQWVRVP